MIRFYMDILMQIGPKTKLFCFTLDYCFILTNEVASWGSKKQQLVVTSYFVSFTWEEIMLGVLF